MTARELQTCTFQGPGASNTTKIPRKDPRERRKKENCGGRREKKARNFGPPTLRGSTLRGSTLRGSTLRGPTFSRFGPPPSGPPSFGGPTLCGPKIQHLKIGRSRNWPKSKMAEVELTEVEKTSWPKSKLAEVDHPRCGVWWWGRVLHGCG